MTVPTRRYTDDAKRIAFFASLTAKLREIPGIESAGAVSYLPLAGPGSRWSMLWPSIGPT